MRFWNKTTLREKISESLSSVLPVTGIVLLLLITFFPVTPDVFLAFVLGAILLIVGMGLFNLGTESALTPMGEYVGSKVTASKRLWVVILVSFFVGVMITVSEPDLQVLANQLSTIPNLTLILAVGLGVGVMLVIAMLRVLLRIRLKYLLLGCYTLVFILAFFIPKNFLAVAFDSGGVTTGPMTVPFIMALGIGVAAISSEDRSGDDSFGLVALGSVGPILSVMLLGLLYDTDAQAVTDYTMPALENSRDVFALFIKSFPHYMKEMAIALGPIVVFFLIFRAISGGLKTDGLGKTMIGVAYTYVGLVLFLTGVNVGFMPVGNYLGVQLAELSISWIIVPLGMVIGYFIVSAEPAVHVLTRQVEEVTAGTISGKLLGRALSIGVAISVGIAMIRVLTGISILWIIVPGYAVALGLSFFVPDIFTAIAFDSGGVASGPMTATFLLPFAVGASVAVGGNVVTDAFGVITMVAMTPLITIQILGLIYKLRTAKQQDKEVRKEIAEEPIVDISASDTDSSEDIIEL